MDGSLALISPTDLKLTTISLDFQYELVLHLLPIGAAAKKSVARTEDLW